MATEKQIEFFEQLLTEREFPTHISEDQLRGQFASLPDKSASAWIERAMSLPEKGSVAPPF